MYDDNTIVKMLLTTAVFAAVAALMAGPATAYVMDVEGGGSSGTVTAAAQPGDPGTIPYLSHGTGVDQSLFQGQTAVELRGDSALTRTELSGPVVNGELDPAIRAAMQAHAAGSAGVQASTGPGAIPYLSHGIGVDESLFAGTSSVGLTGDSPITRGDVSAVSQPTAAATSDGDFDWTWAGFGAGMAVLLAAAMTALYLSARNRDRVALP
jgi:hypothetical protein